MVVDMASRVAVTLAMWPNDPGDLAIYWYIDLGDLQKLSLEYRAAA